MIYIWSRDLKPTWRSSLVRKSRRWDTLTETQHTQKKKKWWKNWGKKSMRTSRNMEKTYPRLCIRPMAKIRVSSLNCVAQIVASFGWWKLTNPKRLFLLLGFIEVAGILGFNFVIKRFGPLNFRSSFRHLTGPLHFCS